MTKQHLHTAAIPLRWVGPISFSGNTLSGDIKVPLATFETPLWPSVARGAKLSRTCGGIETTIISTHMARSITVEAASANIATRISKEIIAKKDALSTVVSETSRYAKLSDIHIDQVANLLYIRIQVDTADASGQNMVTKAAEAILNSLLSTYSELTYVSLSGNTCVDKKVSCINGVLGRGRHVIAELTIPTALCQQYLHTSPKAIYELHIKKNLIGSVLAGSVRSANAHFANMLLACYLATGQDAANIVEGSQGMTHVRYDADNLYFSVSLPHLIVGTAGNGKDLAFVKENLAHLGCDASKTNSANRLAAIIAGTVLCGELSLLAALTRKDDLMRAHLAIERNNRTNIK